MLIPRQSHLGASDYRQTSSIVAGFGGDGTYLQPSGGAGLIRWGTGDCGALPVSLGFSPSPAIRSGPSPSVKPPLLQSKEQ